MAPVHLRRALILFLVVFGLAALVAGLSRPGEEDGGGEPVEAQVEAPSGAKPVQLELDASSPQRRALEAGRAAEVLVSVESAGLVTIPELGLSSAAEELTPARFDVLVRRPGRYPILFTPAGEDGEEPAGTLVVEEARAAG
jgi:hypothetical protein